MRTRTSSGWSWLVLGVRDGRGPPGARPCGLRRQGALTGAGKPSHLRHLGTPADYVSRCKSVGEVPTPDYGKQAGYVCDVVLTDGYKGPVCLIWRDDGEVQWLNRGRCGAPND
jgi:hypothetical protein